MRDTPTNLRRKEQWATKSGMPNLAAIYRTERLDLEAQITGDTYVTCPACSGEGVVERFYDSRLRNCRTCDGSGVVLESEAFE
jgi:RecJ-like exonuclease